MRTSDHKRESHEVRQGVERQLRALVTRCEEGDDAALEALVVLAAAMPEYLRAGGHALHDTGDYSWAGIGAITGTTPQGASQRFRR